MAFIMGLVVLFLFHTKIHADLLHIQDNKKKYRNMKSSINSQRNN